MGEENAICGICSIPLNYCYCTIHRGRNPNPIEITEDECWGRDNAVCPYCGEENEDSWELDERGGDTECGSCGKEYHYERDVSITYTTTKVDR